MLTVGGIALEYAVMAGSLFFLAYASVYDLRDGVIPKWTTYGLAAWNILFSICVAVVWQDFTAILQTIVSGLLFFGAAYFFFLAQQWGGGDVKLMGGIGASLGLLHFFGRAHYAEYVLSFCIVCPLYVVFYLLFGGKTVDEGREHTVMRFAPVLSLAYLMGTYLKLSFI